VAKLDDIPETLLEEFRDVLRVYSVALVGVDTGRDGKVLGYCGSGTLVQSDRGEFVLTAAHVWRKRCVRFQELGITLGPKGSRLHIPVKAMRPTLIDAGDDNEWGPDLALLQLPSEYRGRISTYLNLFNTTRLCRNLDCDDELLRTGAWAVVGAPSDTSTIGPTRIDFDGKVFVGVPAAFNVREGLDHIDFHIGIAPPPRPATLEGVSGGGLWRLGVGRDVASGNIGWDGTAILAGVAYYELLRGGSRIRCHGPASVRRLLELGDVGYAST